MPKKILIIDDDKSTIALLTKVLTDDGYHVVSEEEGICGLETAKSFLPDLILLNVQMLGFNGYHICDKLKSHADFKNIPIIILTSRSEKIDQIVADQVRADIFIAKPFDTQKLLENIKSLLEKYE